MIELDHVIMLAERLDESAEVLSARHGLESRPGGRHPGHGTGNRIIPLGSTYLELMAVVDPEEAAHSDLGRWVLANRTSGLPRPRALCLRTNDIASIAEQLGEEPLAMSRVTPEGRTLKWQLAGLDGMLGAQRRPFFIQWEVAPEDHPATVIAGSHRDLLVTIGRVDDPIANVVKGVNGLALTDGPPGIHSVTVADDKTAFTFEG